MSSGLLPLDLDSAATDPIRKRRIDLLVWAFVGLGTFLRVVQYLLKYPLWIDECMLAEHFLDRDFAQLLTPLGHDQVAPVGFLWIELVLVRLLGFTEWSLRLFPLLCGIASLFLFRHVASRVLAGTPLVLAVGCLAVAKLPIFLSAFVKPYTSDLLMALALLALAVEWLRRPERTRWLWWLAAAVPLAQVLSFPAVFVGAAISLGLLAGVWRRRDRRTWCGYLAFNACLCVGFAPTLLINSGPHAEATRAFMRNWWTQEGGFPPYEPLGLAAWLIDKHTGADFAIPYGADNGGGIVTLVCCLAALAFLWKNGRRSVATIFLATFGLTLAAAFFRRYPYGGHARVLQYTVPAVALTCGLGAACLLSRVARVDQRRRLSVGLMLGLALFGLGTLFRNTQRPYYTAYDEIHREFAMKFWPGESGELTVCAVSDLKRELAAGGWYPYYRCNQYVYSPPHHAGRRLNFADAERLRQPIRLVAYRTYDHPLDPQAVADCLRQFEPAFELAGHEVHSPRVIDDPTRVHGGYEVYHLTPRARIAGNDIRGDTLDSGAR